MRCLAILMLSLLIGYRSFASSSAFETNETPLLHRHAVYVEAFGKGGLWGAGYDYQWDWIGVGATLSLYPLSNQLLSSFSPYVSAGIKRWGRKTWFVQAGPQILGDSVRSPVPEWKGVSRTRVGAELATGYEYRADWLFRVYSMAAIGQGGVAPWIGLSVGWTF